MIFNIYLIFNSKFRDYIRSLNDINSILIYDENADLNLLHIVSANDSVHGDDALLCLIDENEKSLNKPKLDINRRSGSGNDNWTATHLACCFGNVSILEILLNNGANPDILDKNGFDALQIATAFDQFRCLDLIRRKIKTKTFSKDDLNKSYDTVFYSFKDSFEDSIRELEFKNEIKKIDAQLETSGQFNRDHSKTDKKMNKSKSIYEDKPTSSASKVLDRHRKEYEKTCKSNSKFIQDYMNCSLNKTAILNEMGKDLVSRSVNNKSICNRSNDKFNHDGDKLHATSSGCSVIKNLRKDFKNCSISKNDESSSDESIEPFESIISTITIEQNKEGVKELYIDSEFNVTLINETKNGLLNQLETSDSDLDNSQLLIRLDELDSTINDDNKFNIEINVQINRSIGKQNDNQIDYSSLDDDQLFSELVNCGFRPGPINANTRSLYVKKLIELKKVNSKLNNEITILSSTISEKLKITDSPLMFSKPLREMMNGKFDFRLARKIENEFIQNFENQSASKKKFFNYLLLDPRITQNLVKRAVEENPQLYSQLNSQLNDLESNELPKAQSTNNQLNHFNLVLFKLFILAIFYIGKGQGNRPFMHLYDAAKLDQAQRETRTVKKCNIKKLNKIQEIWNSGNGVISLHCFNNVSSIESLSRECLMVSNLKLLICD